jgi:ABC-type phosphate/phosphonate transport system substrate-binding protein
MSGFKAEAPKVLAMVVSREVDFREVDRQGSMETSFQEWAEGKVSMAVAVAVAMATMVTGITDASLSPEGIDLMVITMEEKAR